MLSFLLGLTACRSSTPPWSRIASRTDGLLIRVARKNAMLDVKLRPPVPRALQLLFLSSIWQYDGHDAGSCCQTQTHPPSLSWSNNVEYVLCAWDITTRVTCEVSSWDISQAYPWSQQTLPLPLSASNAPQTIFAATASLREEKIEKRERERERVTEREREIRKEEERKRERRC